MNISINGDAALAADSEGVLLAPVEGVLLAPDKEGVLLAPVPRVLLTPEEAAKAMSISTRKLWELTNAGELPAVRIDRAVRYDVADLRAWAESKKTRGPGEYRRPDGAGVPRAKKKKKRGD